jgi:predicted homoserine dehydrogenase-like protein
MGSATDAGKIADDAVKTGTTWITDDWRAVVTHPDIDIVVECTGNPIAAVDHCLAAFDNRKHVVNVTVEADAFVGRCWPERLSRPVSCTRLLSATSPP